MILAVGECDAENEIICVPETVNELFELPFVGGVNRTILLIALAAIIVVALLYFGIVRQKSRLIPSKFGAFVESLVSFVRDEIAIGIIGPEHGLKYFPWLLSVFLFVLVGNLFEVTPFINFPITSRIAIPAFLALLTWVIFVVSGFKEQGFGYLKESLFPPGVPKPLYLLVTPIEFVSTFLVRPFSLAVRLFANLVAGHVMLSLLLVSGWVFISAQGGIAKIPIGFGWFALGIGIFVFEIIVAMLQAYIFTLLSAVYVQTSVHPEH
ncbi:MAG: F0F1 ATP synthase subunit A [Acidimicrobiia bacterium]|nr:F0F1 ATP synthase subunit A [Acidimicrobiia bacterium]NNF68257.1 F0F1 ATP synthase subunit A [Acidimicrobiia bacterium]NNK92555.1 F0F1 ATP synthase subunit A [Acidimicrobiia bacterium]